MKKSFNFLGISVALLALFVGSGASSARELSEGQVKRLYPSSSGNIYFRLKNDICITGNQYYYFEKAHQSADAWYSMLLASTATEKPIRVSVKECAAEGHVKVRYIYQDY